MRCESSYALVLIIGLMSFSLLNTLISHESGNSVGFSYGVAIVTSTHLLGVGLLLKSTSGGSNPSGISLDMFFAINILSQASCLGI